MTPPFLTLQQTALLSGLSGRTLRHYERIGLLDPLAGTDGGRRRYHASDLTWLAFVTHLRSTGMSLRVMLRYAQLRRRGRRTIGLRRRLLEEHARTVAKKLAALQEELRIVRQGLDYYQALAIEDGEQ
jgi:DNA-binding transcriptional MerR regulator